MQSTAIRSYRPTTVVASSVHLPWEGFVLEKSVSPPGIVVPTSLDSHSIWQLGSLSVRGERSTVRGGFVRYSKTRGDITTVPAGSVLDVRLFTSAEFTCCTFEKSFIEKITDETGDRLSDGPVFSLAVRDATVTRLLNLLSEELEAGAPSGPLYADSLAQALGVRFCMGCSRSSRRPDLQASPLPPAILRKIKALIESSFREKLSLQWLASESGYSRAHFLRMFYASLKQTPHDYVVNRRLNHAKHLLRQGRLPIVSIAVECGFSSQAHMTTLFRRKLRTTPGEFRRNCKAVCGFVQE